MREAVCAGARQTVDIGGGQSQGEAETQLGILLREAIQADTIIHLQSFLLNIRADPALKAPKLAAGKETWRRSHALEDIVGRGEFGFSFPC